MDNLIFSLNATIPIFLVMVVGYALNSLKIVNKPFITTLNSFNYKVTLPVLLFQDIAFSDFSAVWDFGYVAFCFLSTLLCIVVIAVIARFLCRDKSIIGELIQASYRGSAAVLGIAFIQNIYGQSTMAPLMIIGTVPLYNIAAVIILSVTAVNKEDSKRGTAKKTIMGILTNPIILGIILGMLVSVSGITFPVIVTKTISQISVLATPLALICLGAGFEGRKALAKMGPTLVASCIKLVIQPALILPLAIHMGFTGEKLVALLIMSGAPTTVSCYIMAKNTGHEGVLTSSVVVATTFLSSITFTFWLFVLRSQGII